MSAGTKKSTTQPHPSFSADIGITLPLGGDTVTLSSSGTFHVVAKLKTANAFQRVFAKTLPAGTAASAAVPSGAVEMQCPSGDGQTFEHNAVPAVKGSLNGNVNDNRVVVWPTNDPTDAQQTGQSDFREFVGQVSASVHVTVDARNCLWFAWAPGNFMGPRGETGPDYLPQRLLVPSDATGAQITADANDTWTHWKANPDPAVHTNADGRPGTECMTEASYHAAAYNSLNITSPVNIRLNRLVAMWGKTSADAAAEADIGLNHTLNLPAGARPDFLFLGFHDGFQWNTNEGTVDVTVTWQTDGTLKLA